MFKRAIIFYLALFGCALYARAQSIYTTAFAIGKNGIYPDGFTLEYRFEPGAPVFGLGYHTYTIDASSKLVFHGGTLGGVGATLSVVNDGDVLDRSHLAALPGTLNGYQLGLDQAFLVGMYMAYANVFPFEQERFGWARLKYTATGLQIVDQATALGGNAIIAGTTRVLPEPSTLALLGVGVALLTIRRLKSRRENGPPVG